MMMMMTTTTMVMKLSQFAQLGQQQQDTKMIAQWKVATNFVVFFHSYEQDMAEETGFEWVKYVCQQWIHERLCHRSTHR